MIDNEKIEKLATAISNSCDKHGFDLSEAEIDLIALDVAEWYDIMEFKTLVEEWSAKK